MIEENLGRMLVLDELKAAIINLQSLSTFKEVSVIEYFVFEISQKKKEVTGEKILISCHARNLDKTGDL